MGKGLHRLLRKESLPESAVQPGQRAWTWERPTRCGGTAPDVPPTPRERSRSAWEQGDVVSRAPEQGRESWPGYHFFRGGLRLSWGTLGGEEAGIKLTLGDAGKTRGSDPWANLGILDGGHLG